jgi:Zn-dependent peptidase ImmA (M78 family)/transcriptional regulator with XRE-family HTH domain
MSEITTIEPSVLGERLRDARTNALLTQDEAAKRLRLARTTLVAIERGQRKVKSNEIQSFASLYEISVSKLLRHEAVHIDLLGRFRRLESLEDEDPAVRSAITLMNKLATSSIELEALLGISHHPNYPAEMPLGPGQIASQAEDAATTVRSRLGIGLQPISDVVSLIELELGLRVFVRRIDPNISGLFSYDPKIGGCVLINELHTTTRRAMTAAHEVGHFMSDRRFGDVLLENELEDTREERFANIFASALLMPAIAVRRDYQEYCTREQRFTARHVILLSHKYHVSLEAMCRRLESLELLKAGTFEVLLNRGLAKKSSERVLGDEPPPMAVIYPPRLAFLAASAYHRGLMSEGQLCDMLDYDRIELRGIIEAMGGYTSEEEGSPG